MFFAEFENLKLKNCIITEVLILISCLKSLESVGFNDIRSASKHFAQLVPADSDNDRHIKLICRTQAKLNISDNVKSLSTSLH